MHRVKRGILVGFVVLWIAGFVFIAPSPLYRWLFTQANGQSLASPVQLFEGLDWAHPYYYQHIGRAVRDLARQSTSDTLYVYFDPDTSATIGNTHRYFREYQRVWAYPRTIDFITDLDALPSPYSVIVLSDQTPPFDNCIQGQENLYLCQS